MRKPLVLLIRDGWGIGLDYPGNAVKAAKTPNMSAVLAKHPHCVLEASGEAVGVRAGSQGSSEVGHLNMGAGRVVEQEVLRVDKMIRTGELFRVPRFAQAVELCKKNDSTFHLMGLVQDQGVHATQEHLFAILEYLAKAGLKKVCIHFFADGRDTPPRSAVVYLDALEKVIAKCGVGQIATVIGRYYAMDRANNWPRVERAYRAMRYGEGFKACSARQAIEAAYARADKQAADGESIVETDEFISPTVIVDANDKPVGLIQAGDVVMHFNYRQDRALEMTRVFVDKDFHEFNRGSVEGIFYIGLTRYYDEFPYALVPAMNMTNLLGEVLSKAGLYQLRIAEFQKFRHVTSFFNGKMLHPFAGEDRIQVESITIPEDQQPEMSAYQVTDLAVTAIRDGIFAVRTAAGTTKGVSVELLDFPHHDLKRLADTYDVVVLNYANGDMVGHTGVFAAAVKAIEVVDQCLGRIVETVLARDGMVLITSDHGNAEQMTDLTTGKPFTAHTVNDVEFVLVSNDSAKYKLIEHKGKLSDVAPTILKLLGKPIPAEMTAECLVK